jgi:hypothetical protein
MAKPVTCRFMSLSKRLTAGQRVHHIGRTSSPSAELCRDSGLELLLHVIKRTQLLGDPFGLAASIAPSGPILQVGVNCFDLKIAVAPAIASR